MSFGGQTVMLRPVTLGAAGQKGIKARSGSGAAWAGVLFRPVSSDEPTGGNTDEITQFFKATGPPTTVALAADETYELDYDDAPYAGTYVITTVKKHPDLSGAVHHVTVLCRKWVV